MPRILRMSSTPDGSLMPPSSRGAAAPRRAPPLLGLEAGNGPHQVGQPPQRRLAALPLAMIDGRVPDDERPGRQVLQGRRLGADDRPIPDLQVPRDARL